MSINPISLSSFSGSSANADPLRLIILENTTEAAFSKYLNEVMRAYKTDLPTEILQDWDSYEILEDDEFKLGLLSPENSKKMKELFPDWTKSKFQEEVCKKMTNLMRQFRDTLHFPVSTESKFQEEVCKKMTNVMQRLQEPYRWAGLFPKFWDFSCGSRASSNKILRTQQTKRTLMGFLLP